MSFFVVDGRFTPEGFSMSVYDGESFGLVEEVWFTWSEIDELKGIDESAFTVEL